MNKQSPYSPYPNLVFRETFNSEAECRRNGGTPTDVDFSNGKVITSSASRISYDSQLNEVVTLRFRINVTAQSADNQYLFDARGSNTDGIGLVNINANSDVIVSSSGTKYVNGVISSTILFNQDCEVIISGIIVNVGTTTGVKLISFLNRHSFSFGFTGSCDLIEIYQGTLTASEVANLYNDVWNTEQSFGNTLLDFDSTNGVLEDRTVGDVVGDELAQPLDFANWALAGIGSSVIDSDTFMSGDNVGSGIKKYYGLGTKKYRLYIQTSSDGIMEVRNGQTGTSPLLVSIPAGTNVTNVVEFTASEDYFYLRGITALTEYTVSYFIAYEIRPELSHPNVTLHKTGSNYAALFNGSDSVIAVGNIGTVSTLNFILYYDGTNQNGIIDLNGTNTVSHSSGTLSYPTGNAFINGVDTNTLTIGWNFITILLTTPIAASAFRLGYDGSNYFKGMIAKCSAQDSVLTITQHTQWYTSNLRRMG